MEQDAILCGERSLTYGRSWTNGVVPLMAASEALSLGYGGVFEYPTSQWASRKAIARGSLRSAERNPIRVGFAVRCGRKSIVERDPKLLVSLDRLIEPETRGRSRISLALDLPKVLGRWLLRLTRKSIQSAQ